MGKIWKVGSWPRNGKLATAFVKKRRQSVIEPNTPTANRPFFNAINIELVLSRFPSLPQDFSQHKFSSCRLDVVAFSKSLSVFVFVSVSVSVDLERPLLSPLTFLSSRKREPPRVCEHHPPAFWVRFAFCAHSFLCVLCFLFLIHTLFNNLPPYLELLRSG